MDPIGRRRCCNPLKRSFKGHRTRLVQPYLGQWMCGSCRLQVARKNEAAAAAAEGRAHTHVADFSSGPVDESAVLHSTRHEFLQDSMDLLVGSPPGSPNAPSATETIRTAEDLLPADVSHQQSHSDAEKTNPDQGEISESPAETPEIEDRCGANCKILEKLIETYKASNTQAKKMRILSIAVESVLGDRQLAKLFDCHKSTVVKARRLYGRDGVLSTPDSKQYDRVSENDKKLARDFYCLDDYSCRPMTGTRDFVDGVPKRLLLLNLRELYVAFKEKYPAVKMGFSSFCALRPRHCVFAGSRGTLNVCVCMIHQNPKLMIEGAQLRKLTDDAVDPISSCDDCLRLMVCDMENSRCRLGSCTACPGEKGLTAKLKEIFIDNAIENITFKLWETVDRCKMEIYTKPVDEFISLLLPLMTKLLSHSYISKQQSSFLHKKKENLKDNEVIIIGDYSENYSFVAPDAPQTWHWSNSMATVHPFVVYYKHEGVLNHFSHVVISSYLTHNTAAVHLFQKKLMGHIREKVGLHITDVLYFSDGCSAQYKNKCNFSNLVHHEDDFGMRAEWHFFATSHGKGPCDGVGGTVKRLAARASIQNRAVILTAHQFYLFIVKEMPGTVFDFTDETEHKEHEKLLKARFNRACTLQGTRSYHSIVPQADGSVAARRYSNSEEFEIGIVSG